MIEAPLALAFASGMVAAVNPCGFAMLPAYVGFFLGQEGDRTPSRGESVARAIPVALSVSLGFVAVFGVVGIGLRSVSGTVQEYAPWATIVIGVGLVLFGIITLGGYELSARMPTLNRGGRSRGLGSMFVYGVSYAIASLTCTLGIFIATIVNAFSRTDFVSGVSVLLMYAAGMGLVITTLTVAIALARDSVVRVLRSGMRYADRLAGGLMVLMGAYVAWYGIFSLRVRTDPGTAAGPVDLVERWSGAASRFVQDVGAARLGLSMLAVLVLMVGASVAVGMRHRDDRDAGTGDAATGSETTGGETTGGPGAGGEDRVPRNERVAP